MWYRSCLVQVNTICNTRHSMHKLVVNLQRVIVVARNDPAFRSFLPVSRGLLTFSRWGCARCWRGHYARWMQLYVRVTDHKCSISISSIFDSGFWYLPTFLTVLRYWAPPNVPLLLGGENVCRTWAFRSYGNNITTNVKTSTHFFEKTYFILFSFE